MTIFKKDLKEHMNEQTDKTGDSKGQLNSEWIHEVNVSPKMQTKFFKDFCPTKQTRIVAKKPAYSQQKITKKKC